jgi:hypothetical protein
VPTRKPFGVTGTPERGEIQPTAVPSATSGGGGAPTAAPAPSATVEPTAVIVSSPGDSYKTVLNHSYTVPAGWTKTVVGESIVLKNSAGTTKVTITERQIDRWRFPAINVLGVTSFPDRPVGWDTWYSASVGLIKGDQAYEYQFTGAKDNVSYLNFIQWYLWGDINVEVNSEITAFDWNSSSAARAELQSVLDSFKPHDGVAVMTVSEVLAVLEERLDNRPSGIYVRDEVIRGRVELTCRQVFEDLLNQPEYVGNGTWQTSAYTLDGVETWWVYEPSGTIVSVNSNRSKC